MCAKCLTCSVLTCAGVCGVWYRRYQFITDGYGQQHAGMGFAHVVPEQARAFFGEVWAQGQAQSMASTCALWLAL